MSDRERSNGEILDFKKIKGIYQISYNLKILLNLRDVLRSLKLRAYVQPGET